MGIYSNGSIFGIQIYNYNDDISTILFENKFEEEMSYNQMREAHIFYSNLKNKENIFFKIYTECSSTLDFNLNNFMMWQPLSLDDFYKHLVSKNLKCKK